MNVFNASDTWERKNPTWVIFFFFKFRCPHPIRTNPISLMGKKLTMKHICKLVLSPMYMHAGTEGMWMSTGIGFWKKKRR